MIRRQQKLGTMKVRPEDFLRPDFEIVRMTEPTLDIINANFLQRKILDMTVELVCMHDLIKQLDPNHMYLYSAEYQGFVKTPVANKVKEDVSSQHSNIVRGPQDVNQ